jgi:putative FmdB family regulatory protein
VPTYQYACTECGERLEAVQSFSDPALTECPACQGKLRKVFNSVGVVFKGSGFYRNDSRKPVNESSSAGPSETKSETKSDSKSESAATPAKTESKPVATTTTSTPSAAKA